VELAAAELLCTHWVQSCLIMTVPPGIESDLKLLRWAIWVIPCQADQYWRSSPDDHLRFF